jgi:hypothetical protein
MEETILGRKTYCAIIAGRRGISNESVQTKRQTRAGNKSMETLKMTPAKEKKIYVTVKGENIFVQARAKGVVNKNFLLLDNQSMVSQIANPSLIKNIWKLSKPITVYCNTGVTKTDLE